MTYVVIDTSVLFKLFLAYGEDGLDETWALVRSHQRQEILLIAPALGAIEIANVLRYIGIDEATALCFLDDFEGLGIELVPQTPARIRAAVSCAFTYKISIYDALFLALAQEFDCELVTADRRAFGSIPAKIAKVKLSP